MPAPVLAYADAATAPPRGHRRRLAFLLLSSPSLVLPFLPFYFNVSPLDAAVQSRLYAFPFGNPDWTIGLLGLSFFAAPLAVAYHTLLHLRPNPSRALLRRILIPLAVLANLPLVLLHATVFITTLRTLADGDSPDSDLWIFILSLALHLAGLTLTFLLARRRRTDFALSLACTCPFLANSTLCLIAFFDTTPQPGYLLTAALVPVFLLDLILRSTDPP